MLELKNVTKIYGEGAQSKVTALSNVTLSFRKTEFVSVLGPSGCGKSTMLNIIGGLDRYTEGEMIVDGVETSDFSERDWDTYRNRKIGFVFQSYNLIAHQTVLENVELALTLSGVDAHTRKRLAMGALERVGLANHLHKKPNELSGGEMQRVAIARALVNNPEVILADEPTGALDSKTSILIMELLKEIAKDRLVIMVTHNDALAQAYSTRIIKLLDSKVVSDSNYYNGEISEKSAYKSINGKKQVNKKQKDKDEIARGKAELKKKHTSMSFKLSLSLSLKNLLTKKTRTFLTALASSIGIVGLALVLALFNGLNMFLNKVQHDTLSFYPMFVSTSKTEDIEEYINIILDDTNYISNPDMKDKIFVSHLITKLNSAKIQNKITPEYLEYLSKIPEEYVRDITYSYGTGMNVYKKKVVFDTSEMNIQLTGRDEVVAFNVGVPVNKYFKQIIGDEEFILSQYEMVAGQYPKEANELCLVLDKNNRITDTMLVAFLMDINATQKNEDGTFKKDFYEYDDFLKEDSNFGTFTLAFNDGLYKDTNSDGLYERQEISLKDSLSKNSNYGESVATRIVSELGKMGISAPNCYNGGSSISESIELKITCILRLKDQTTTGAMGAYPIGYTPALAELLREKTVNSSVVKAQLLERQKINDNDSSTICKNLLTGGSLTAESAVNDLMRNYFGYAETPTKIEFYATSFENKVLLKKYLAEYNNLPTTKEEDRVNVVDTVSAIIDLLKTFIDTITYILIALTAISLVVAAIMIAIITYVSVIERTKEIGVLRSIGARKIDVMSVFNAETVIIGLFSGIIGIVLAIIAQFPLNALLYSYTGISSLVVLSPVHALLLVVVSILVTLLSGMIPAFMASKKDPVKALRSE